MSNLQFRLADVSFRPTWLGTIVVLLAIPMFIKLGLWQYHKAEQKLQLQQQFDRYLHAPAVPLPVTMDDATAWRYHRVRVTGVYDASHQILLDNQVYQDRAGYHVLTPLRTAGNRLVLINRGWVPGAADHTRLPQTTVPTGEQTITGQVWIPPSKFFSLESTAPQDSPSAWTPVWQNLDMARYAGIVQQPVSPIIIRLDQDAAGGYVRDWPRPAERIETHIGYAYQWFGFAVAAFCIYLYVGFRKRPA